MLNVKERSFRLFLKKSFTFFYAFILAFSFLDFASATELADVVQFKITETNQEKNQISAVLVTKNNFKIYKDNLSFDFLQPGAFPEKLSYTTTPDAQLMDDPFSGKEKYVFWNNTSFLFNVSSKFNIGDRISISIQACSQDVCLLPAHLDIRVARGSSSTSAAAAPLSNFSNTDSIQHSSTQKNISQSQSEAKPNNSGENTVPASNTLANTIQKFLTTGSIFLFPILFLAGLLTNLTPCVYPMIPITLGVMKQFGKGQKSSVKLAFIYVFGMVITYSLLGVGAAMTGQVFGSQLSSPILNGVVAGVMVLLGLAMLDFFDLSILQRLSYKIPYSNKSPVLAVGTMGAVSGLVAAPCTGPILSMILVLIAQTREPVTGFLYMLCFALGFGTPYVALGILSQKLNKLPKMHGMSGFIKLLFACLMFALAFFFLKSTLSSTEFFRGLYVQPSWSSVIAVSALFLLFIGIKKPKFKFFSRLSSFGSIATFSVMCLWLMLWLSNAFVSQSNIDNSVAYEDALQNSSFTWESDLKVAVREAQKHDKKILVDIWAEWCAACLEMDKTTWNDDRIINLLKKSYIPVKLNYTKPSTEISDLLSQWKILGLPAVLIFSPEDLKTPIKVNQGLISTTDLIKQLNKY